MSCFSWKQGRDGALQVIVALFLMSAVLTVSSRRTLSKVSIPFGSVSRRRVLHLRQWCFFGFFKLTYDTLKTSQNGQPLW